MENNYTSILKMAEKRAVADVLAGIVNSLIAKVYSYDEKDIDLLEEIKTVLVYLENACREADLIIDTCYIIAGRAAMMEDKSGSGLTVQPNNYNNLRKKGANGYNALIKFLNKNEAKFDWSEKNSLGQILEMVGHCIITMACSTDGSDTFRDLSEEIETPPQLFPEPEDESEEDTDE